MEKRESQDPTAAAESDSAPKPSRSRRTGAAETPATALARRKVTSPNPRSAASHFTRGETHRRMGRYHAAILEYRKAVELAPEVPYYRYKLGDCYAAAGLGGNALKELEIARDLAPTDGFYHFWLGDVYARMGRPLDAIHAMQQATLYAPDDAYFNIRLGMVYYQACALQEAADAFRNAVALEPDNASYHCLLGDTYVRLGYEREALMHFRMAGRLDPYDAAYVERARRVVALGACADRSGDRVTPMFEKALEEEARLDTVQRELLTITWRMLNAIHTGDADLYAALCTEDLSCFEDVCAYRIDGLEFHLSLIRQMAQNPAMAPARFDILTPRIQVYGGVTGIVTYTRLMTYDEGGKPRWTTFNETRTFVLLDGAWKMAHFHRSPT